MQQARAKLNLYLHITGQRADGYHTLESMVVFTDLADTLTVKAADILSLSVHGVFANACGATEKNLVMKAARALQSTCGIQQGAALGLEKNIPVGAGLGGGSADAAACLHLLNAHWQLGLSLKELQRIGLPLGADVPVCLAGVPSIMRGVGEQLSPVGMPPLYATLVYPNKPLSTAQAYAMFQLPQERKRRVAGFVHHEEQLSAIPHEDSRGDAKVLFSQLRRMRNDLQRPAISLMPEIAEILLALETAPGATRLARMSGSGSSCFALTYSAEDASHITKYIRHEYPQWWVQTVVIEATDMTIL